MKYKITIIMPIYNQEKYLCKSIESVINQTIGFENIELILVDDCSNDNSKNIINYFSDKYHNVFPIFLDENSGGPAIPKNKGLINASSDYVIFFDSDDYLMPDFCEVMFNKINEEHADIVSGNAILVVNKDLFYDINYSDGREVITDASNIGQYKGYRCWGSIFSREFLIKNDIIFLNAKSGEDTYFAYKCFFNSKKIYFLDNYFGIFYFKRGNDSITQTHNKLRIMASIYSRFEIMKMLQKDNVNINSDPFLIEMYREFGNYWDTSKNDEIEIYEKILQYKHDFNYPSNLPIQYKIADRLLEKNKFLILHFYRIFCAWLAHLRLINYIFNPRKKINEDSIIYRKFLDLKLYDFL